MVRLPEQIRTRKFLTYYDCLQIAQENKYFKEIFSYVIMKMYVVCSHLYRPIEVILISTLNTSLFYRWSKRHP